MCNTQILLILAIAYYLFVHKPKEGFVSMHDHRENALYRDM